MVEFIEAGENFDGLFSFDSEKTFVSQLIKYKRQWDV